ncbi:hypothetical protein RRG08_041183 [Elysia crispata]|uniref:Uncharacterized protein n=1 Tax=Elysia crispata TaxID=231223 RepID=A0AAE0XYL5_9GAST|nr:hypothetical protein RRG08_041183 [Elysia crispata]
MRDAQRWDPGGSVGSPLTALTLLHQHCHKAERETEALIDVLTSGMRLCSNGSLPSSSDSNGVDYCEKEIIVFTDIFCLCSLVLECQYHFPDKNSIENTHRVLSM